MKLTQKQKIEQFDQLAADKQKLDLAVYDLVNHKFGIAKTYTPKQISENFQYAWDDGAITVAMSWRANPLFLVRSLGGGREHVTPEVWTETEIQDNHRAHPNLTYWRIVMHARNQLVLDQMRKEQAA